MKLNFALVDGQRLEPQPGLKGTCPNCGNKVTAKCGNIRVKHWSHVGKLICDPWWENKTAWHLAWQRLFPANWREVSHLSETGEKHIADVKTDQDWVLEFQYSPISPEERQARNNFYPKLVWVINGWRRKRDIPQFNNALKEVIQINNNPPANIPIYKLGGFFSECALLRDWVGNPTPVFFDFNEPQFIWYLFPKTSDGNGYLVRFERSHFLALFLNGDKGTPYTDFWFKEIVNSASDLNSRREALARRQTDPLPVFQQYLSRRDRYRRRF